MIRKTLSILIAVLFTSFLGLVAHAGETKEPIRHFIAVQFKAGTTEAQIQQVTDAFRELQEKIPGITSFEHGVNDSPENLNRGFTHVYLLTFENADARDEYLPHPEHKKFGEMVKQLDVLESLFVIDYAAQK